MKTSSYGSVTLFERRSPLRVVLVVACALILLAAVSAPAWAPALWPGKGTQRLSFEEALDLVVSTDVSEGNRINGAGRVVFLIKKAIYEMRITEDTPDTPKRLRDGLGKVLSRIEKMPSEPIPQRWLDRRK